MGDRRDRKDDKHSDFDWSQAESELRDVLPPMFVGSEGTDAEGAAAEAVDATTPSAPP